MKHVISAITALAVTSVSAVAADMPMKSRPVAASAFSWTGVYAGASVGYGWDRTWDDFNCRDRVTGPIFGGCGSPGLTGTIPPPASFTGTGALAGFQAGLNYQFGAVVAGLEADYSWSRIRGEGTSNFLMYPAIADVPASIISGQKLSSFGTIRGRLGWLPSQHWLIYATGGVAFGHRDQDVALYGPSGVTLTFASRV